MRDYYHALGIDLPYFERKDNWWLDKDHAPLFDNFAKAGFYQVDNVQDHDVLLAKVGRTYHINHAMIFNGGKIIHHLQNRLSCAEPIGRYKVIMALRHCALDNGAWD